MKTRAFFWNMVSCTASALATVLLLAAVTRFCGDASAGIFSIAFVTAQLLMNLGHFGVRAYQASDIGERFTFPQYFTGRLLTCSAMAAAGGAYVLWNGLDREKGTVVLLLCVFKMFDTLADVFEGRFQQKGRMDLAGLSLFLRTVCSTAVFILVLWCTRDLVVTCWVSAAAGAVLLLLFGWLPCRRYAEVRLSGPMAQVGRLLAECTPLFLSLFLLAFLVNAPKYAIDRLMEPQYQTYYNILYLPAQVAYLFSTFLFKPIVTTLAARWERGETARFWKTVRVTLLLTGAATVLALGAAYVLGLPVLEAVYGVDLGGYRAHLLVIILAGGCGALGNVLYYALAVLRAQRGIFLCYGAAFLFSLFLPGVMTGSFGMMGAALSYLALMAALTLLLGGLTLYCRRRAAPPKSAPERGAG